MKMIFKAFAKNLFGAKYERLRRNLFVSLILFWGLHIAGQRLQIAPFIRYFMLSSFSAGVMWQALFSEDNTAKMQNMLMLPFDRRKFVFSYIAALGAYTVFTKTAVLLAVLLAVSVWEPIEVCGGIICVINAVLMTAAAYTLKKHWYAVSLWGGAVIASILILGNEIWIVPLLAVNSVLAVVFLQAADGYAFYPAGNSVGSFDKVKRHKTRKVRGFSVWRYLFRYLASHKNYLTNTAVMWCVALILPRFFGKMEGLSAVPVSFAILSLNTPICILLSCDPDSEQAVRFLPGQKKAFCIPYCLFIFLWNMAANIIFLCSWQAQNRNVTALMVLTALFFALQSAILSVLLEWFYPVRDWKIESDLWHHPRKYVVPATMLLIAGAVQAFQVLIPILLLLLAVEAGILVFICVDFRFRL